MGTRLGSAVGTVKHMWSGVAVVTDDAYPRIGVTSFPTRPKEEHAGGAHV